MLEYREKRIELKEQPAEYVLSDGKPDRMEDTIDPKGWQLSAFSTMALFNHSRDAVIGKWQDVRVQGDNLVAKLFLAEAGTSPVVDMVRALVKQGMLDEVSVGFRALEKRPRDPADPFGPQHFSKTELLEASLVSVAANPRARRIVKEFLSEEVEQKIFRGQTISTKAEKKMQTNSQKLVSAEQELVQLRERMTALEGALGEAGPTPDQAQEVEALSNEIAQKRAAIETYKRIEQSMINQVRGGIVQPAQSQAPAVWKGPYASKVQRRADHIIRVMTGLAMQSIRQKQGRNLSLTDTIAECYPGDEDTVRYVDYLAKAASQPASTTVAGWASELVNQTMADFIGFLPRSSVYQALSSRGVKFTFGPGVGIIKIPSRSSTPKINGSFVGEGQPIPVRRLGTGSITLTPKKMAVISEMTKEISVASTPALESVIRQAINEDTAEAIDQVLIDATAADAIRPAGLRNGVAGLTPSAATATFDKMVADLKALIGAITAVNGGRELVLICNPAQALSLSWITTPMGTFPFDSVDVKGGELRGLTVISSITVTAGLLIMVDAADFASVTSDTPEFDVSDQAVIHEEDTSPLPISATGTPNTVAAPVRSLWQTYSLGIRMILPMNWAMRRTGMVSWMTGVTW